MKTVVGVGVLVEMEVVVLQGQMTVMWLAGGEVALSPGAAGPAAAVAVREDRSPSWGQASSPVGQPVK